MVLDPYKIKEVEQIVGMTTVDAQTWLSGEGYSSQVVEEDGVRVANDQTDSFNLFVESGLVKNFIVL